MKTYLDSRHVIYDVSSTYIDRYGCISYTKIPTSKLETHSGIETHCIPMFRIEPTFRSLPLGSSKRAYDPITRNARTWTLVETRGSSKVKASKDKRPKSLISFAAKHATTGLALVSDWDNSHDVPSLRNPSSKESHEVRAGLLLYEKIQKSDMPFCVAELHLRLSIVVDLLILFIS